MGDAGIPESLRASVESTKVSYKQLGSSGLRVSIPILGAMSFGESFTSFLSDIYAKQTAFFHLLQAKCTTQQCMISCTFSLRPILVSIVHIFVCFAHYLASILFNFGCLIANPQLELHRPQRLATMGDRQRRGG